MPSRRTRVSRKSSGNRKRAIRLKKTAMAKSSPRKNRIAKPTSSKAKPDNPNIPWDLSKGTTYSFLDLYLQCPEQAYQRYVVGYTPRKLKPALEFGSLWHNIQEHYYDNPKANASKVAIAQCKAYEKFRKPNIFKNDLAAFELMLGIAEVMFPLYASHWKEDDLAIDWIEPEQKFKTRYEFIDLNGKKREIYLRGMRDGVYRDDGELGVFETKTKSQVEDSSIRDQLRADLQTLIYATTAMLDHGERPKQLTYNIVRKPSIKPKSGESLQDYLKRLKADVKKRPQFYFSRWHVELTKADIDNFRKKTLDPILRIFCAWADGLKKTGALDEKPEGRWSIPHHFLNCAALVGKYGRVDMFDVVTKNVTTGYYKRKLCFPELSE